MHTSILLVSERIHFYVAYCILLKVTKNKDLINWLLGGLFGTDLARGNFMSSMPTRIESVYSH